MPSVEPIGELLRIEGGQVLATLIRLVGDFDIAEEAVAEACLAALSDWPIHGVPTKPGAWLTTVAKHRALDRIRRESTRRVRETEAVRLLGDTSLGGEFDERHDDGLRLLFTCCHPALSPDAQVALTLRTICGLTTTEIARVFLAPEATIAQRISRAKAKIRTARIPYRVPPDDELPDRLAAVQSTIYALFTAGHHAPAGEAGNRVDLAVEAIRLGRLLVGLMPDEPECRGLLALMLAAHARRGARFSPRGDLILLPDQDRSRWDPAAISEADMLTESVLRTRRAGPYSLQAAIHCVHNLAQRWVDTDWPQIAELYRLLEQRVRTPAIRVNRAVAEAEFGGAAAGLALLDDLDTWPNAAVAHAWHLYWSTRAEIELRAGARADAAAHFARALGCTPNDADRRHLERRLAVATAGTAGDERLADAAWRQ